MLRDSEMRKWIASVSNLYTAVWNKRWELSKEASKLFAYNTLLEPPTTIREANYARALRLYKESDECQKLADKLDKVLDTLRALPTILTYESWDGTEREFITEGMLPDFSRTSLDEAEALKMLADYYAAKEQARATA